MAEMGQQEEPEGIDALEPLRREPDEIRTIVKRVLQLEQERLYEKKPHLNEDVVRILKEEVK